MEEQEGGRDAAGGPGLSRSRRDQPLHCSGSSSPRRTLLPSFILTLPAASLVGSAGSRQILPFVPN